MPADSGTPTSGEGGATPCAEPVVEVSGYLVIDGCKVARVEPGGVLAFPDKCRGRVQRRGCDQVRVRVTDLARAIEASEG